ncbi:MAG: 50S ribosomal protein L18, partial [Opitutales bacterium]|nr:50S ribosomal protein L18 [Opitutales bacterium]
MKIQKKRELEQKRRWRIRKKVAGTEMRPRLSVHFSNKHIYAQVINDDEGKTLVFVS